MDWSITSSTRLMVRYTQDSWVASNLAGGTDGVWGDSQTSVVGSDWDQPGKSLVAQLNQNIGSKMTNSLTFSYSANKISVARSGDAAKVDTLNGLIPTLFPSDIKKQGGTAQPWYWGTAGYGDLWNQAPWLNNQDLYVLKDDWSAVFGKHFVKAGFLTSWNAKNEEVNNTSQEGVGLNGTAGFITPSGFQTGLTTGNGAADILLAGMAFNTNEIRTNPNVQQRWRDFEFYIGGLLQGLAARDGWTSALRFSHMQPPWMEDDRQGNFVPSAVNPALGNAPCNGILYPPGTNPCPALGLAGGGDAVGRSLVPIKGAVDRPAHRRGLGPQR